MQNSKKIFLLFFFSLAFLGCERRSTSENSIDLKQVQEVSVFDIFAEVDAIQLETKEECLLTQVSRVCYYDDKMYFLDYGMQQVFCFSDEGKFLFKVSRQGNGQGEYNWVSDVAIDKERKRLLILDAPPQRILFFDLDGNYIETITVTSEVSLGLNRVFPLNDSKLLFTGGYERDFILYCLKTSTITERFGALSASPAIFSPIRNSYLFNDECFVTPPLGNTTYKVSGSGFGPHFTWCFGKDNNTHEQLEKLKAKFPEWKSSSLDPIYPYVVGKGRFLNSLILLTFETDRYRVACLEHDGDFKNVVVDKTTGHNYVFRYFEEGLRFFPQNLGDNAHTYCCLNSGFELVKNSILSGRWYSQGGEEMKPYDEDFYFNRYHTFYTRDILTERGKQVYDNHDPMHDNPYLVIFRFKE